MWVGVIRRLLRYGVPHVFLGSVYLVPTWQRSYRRRALQPKLGTPGTTRLETNITREMWNALGPRCDSIEVE